VAFAKFARTIGYCDNEPASRGVLERKIESGELDDAPIFEDVKKLHPKDLPPCENGWDAVDLVTAGFPCQDISCAGLHAGLAKGTRSSLVKQVVRLIRELGGGGATATRKNVQNGANKNVATGNIPSYVFLENVSGITSKSTEYMGLLSSLNDLGYDTFWDFYSAAGSGAIHRRRRWFLLGVRRHPAPVPVQAKVDSPLTKLLASSFKESVIIPADGDDEHAAALRRQAYVSMELLGNAVVPAQANRAFAGLHARAKRILERTASGTAEVSSTCSNGIPVPGMHINGAVHKLDTDPSNIDPPVAKGGPFKFNVKPLAKGAVAYKNKTALKTGRFSMKFLGTPRRHHARASAPTERAFADFGTGVAFCEAFAKGVDPRGATVRHTFSEAAMGFPRDWTRDPAILPPAKRRR